LSLDLGSKISVCLLSYNHAHLIHSTLESVLNQTIQGYEIIVSDDCSTDDSWKVLSEIASTDDRIKLVRTPNNLGMPGNANFAVAQSDRPYIAILHHDDIYREDLLEKWAMILERNPGAGFVFNRYLDKGASISNDELPGECFSGDWLLENHLFPRWGCVVRGTTMVRLRSFQAVGGFDPHFGLLSDVDLWMRLAQHYSVGYSKDPLIIVRYARPSNYPKEYKAEFWSWRRLTILYDIHAVNRQRYFSSSTLRSRWAWWKFRLKVSMETAKWLSYALVRNRFDMIRSANESTTAYDLPPLNWYRRFIRIFFES
jgi:glycosyltransferase involved in cell wall biosynthesis